jgi:Icc-related predicted phosphoesterase
MKMLFAADLHYTLKQLDWLVANAGRYDLVNIGGDLLDLGSALDTVIDQNQRARYDRHRPAGSRIRYGEHARA